MALTLDLLPFTVFHYFHDNQLGNRQQSIFVLLVLIENNVLVLFETRNLSFVLFVLIENKVLVLFETRNLSFVLFVLIENKVLGISFILIDAHAISFFHSVALLLPVSH